MDSRTERIRIARKKLKKTQADFASAVGVGRNRYISWEKEGIPEKYMDSLSRTFHINPVFLETGVGEVLLPKTGHVCGGSTLMNDTKDIAMNAMAKTIREQELYIAKLELENEELREQLALKKKM